MCNFKSGILTKGAGLFESLPDAPECETCQLVDLLEKRVVYRENEIAELKKSNTGYCKDCKQEPECEITMAHDFGCIYWEAQK